MDKWKEKKKENNQQKLTQNQKLSELNQQKNKCKIDIMEKADILYKMQ